MSLASSLTDTLYGDYKWAFRALGIITLLGSLAYYLYSQKGVCSFNEVKRRRNEIINYLALTTIAGVFGYLFFLYGIVHYLGVWLSIWE